MTVAFPLHWPFGRPRTPDRSRRRATFNRREHNGRYTEAKALTVAIASERLQFEVDQLGAANLVLSTNVQLRLDGKPRSGQADPADPGAALYFTLKGHDIVLACDRWDRVADNIAAIAKHVEAMRGMERWGVGSIEQAFAGYQALPYTPAAQPEKQAWWIVLGVDQAATWEEIEQAWRTKVRAAHPDQGGDPALASRLNVARDEARQDRTYHV